MSVRILQRNRTKRRDIETEIEIEICKEIYYKELAYMIIMEAKKSQGLQLASGRLRGADGIVSVPVQSSENLES